VVAFLSDGFVSVCVVLVARATVKMLSKTQTRRGRSFLIIPRTLSKAFATVNR
jgi:hypothetical protein